jgi:hypothetical protein
VKEDIKIAEELQEKGLPVPLDVKQRIDHKALILQKNAERR